MRNELYFSGVFHHVGRLSIGDSRVFEGSGRIYGAGIRRTSKNRYEFVVITNLSFVGYPVFSLKKAINVLQDFYDRLGA